jgi:hypothetical protein
MRENVGGWDRRIRSVAGPILLGVGARLLARRRNPVARLMARRASPIGGVAAVLAGALLSQTALTRVCPMSSALGINTAAR